MVVGVSRIIKKPGRGDLQSGEFSEGREERGAVPGMCPQKKRPEN